MTARALKIPNSASSPRAINLAIALAATTVPLPALPTVITLRGFAGCAVDTRVEFAEELLEAELDDTLDGRGGADREGPLTEDGLNGFKSWVFAVGEVGAAEFWLVSELNPRSIRLRARPVNSIARLSGGEIGLGAGRDDAAGVGVRGVE